jgi:hypothetical protein
VGQRTGCGRGRLNLAQGRVVHNMLVLLHNFRGRIQGSNLHVMGKRALCQAMRCPMAIKVLATSAG